MNILVTGSSGFVGKKLISKLSSEHNVSKVLRKMISSKECRNSIIVDGIDSTTNFYGKLVGFECIIHCAARVHVMNEIDNDPLTAFREVNVNGTLNLAEAAIASGVKRFIFISTIKVNGESTTNNEPYSNVDKALPKDPYAISKFEAEQKLINLTKDSNMELVIIRPPLVYGPGVKANFLFMLKLISAGIPLPFGSINHNKRSMVYLGNLIDLIIECITNPNAANQTFLVSDDNDLSTKTFVQGLSRSLDKSTFLIPISSSVFSLVGKILGKSEIVDRLCGSLQVDITYTKNILNWKPPYTVEEGFAATAKSFKNIKITTDF